MQHSCLIFYLESTLLLLLAALLANTIYMQSRDFSRFKANEEKTCSKSEIRLKLARKADDRLFLSFLVKKVVESV